MTLLDLLRAHWNIWGLDAPKFAWLAAAGLLLFPLCALFYLFREVRGQHTILSDAADRIDRLRSRISTGAKYGIESGPRRSFKDGLTASAYSALSDILGASPALSHVWSSYAATLVVRSDGTGDEQFWASESAAMTFTDAAVWEGRVNRAFYNSIPGVVTSTGLLFTFLAILVALIDVRIDTQTNQIAGLPLLIEGLSGKFVSSIAALLSATIFLLAEKPLIHRLSRSRLRLASSIDALVPRLSSTRVMAEIHREIGAMAELASQTGKASAEQFELSKTQVKASTLILRQFMTQMNDTAGSSITHMAVTLTGVVRDLSEKVNDLGAQMAAALQKTSEQTAETTAAVVENMEKLSSRRSEQLDQVIEQLHIHADEAKEMEYQFASLNAALSEITTDVNAMSERLQELTESLERLRGSADAKRA
jgi:methyl-accepting chemotaxis protein